MTQREEIENNIGYKITKAAMEYYQANCANDVDLSDAFEEGAEWMQETVINMACDWIRCMALDYIQGDITDVKWASMFADLRNYIENGDN